VTRAHDLSHFAQQAADLSEHRLADDRVRLHQRPLCVVERAGLVDDRRWNLDFADVVKQRSEFCALAVAQPESTRMATVQATAVACLNGSFAGILALIIRSMGRRFSRLARYTRTAIAMVLPKLYK